MASSSHGSDIRRRFIASLKDDEGPRTASQTSHGRVIMFSMQKLREFQGSQLIRSGFKASREVPRLRPNYDSTKRKLDANPVERVKHLVIFKGVFQHASTAQCHQDRVKIFGMWTNDLF